MYSWGLMSMFLSNIAGSNVSAYVGMVNDVLRVTIPKAVAHCQVREAKRSLLDAFYIQVGKIEVRIVSTAHPKVARECVFLPVVDVGLQGKRLAQMLDEDPALMERRQACGKRLELYKNARDEIDSVAWAK